MSLKFTLKNISIKDIENSYNLGVQSNIKEQKEEQKDEKIVKKTKLTDLNNNH